MYRFIECTVEKYMTRAVRTVTRSTTMRELEALFEKYDFNSFPVVEEGKMFGIVSKFDFLRAFAFTTGQMFASAECDQSNLSSIALIFQRQSPVFERIWQVAEARNREQAPIHVDAAVHVRTNHLIPSMIR